MEQKAVFTQHEIKTTARDLNLAVPRLVGQGVGFWANPHRNGAEFSRLLHNFAASKRPEIFYFFLPLPTSIPIILRIQPSSSGKLNHFPLHSTSNPLSLMTTSKPQTRVSDPEMDMQINLYVSLTNTSWCQLHKHNHRIVAIVLEHR